MKLFQDGLTRLNNDKTEIENDKSLEEAENIDEN